MSSLNCPDCQRRIWDKVKGNLIKSREIDGVFYCLKCSKGRGVMRPITMIKDHKSNAQTEARAFLKTPSISGANAEATKKQMWKTQEKEIEALIKKDRVTSSKLRDLAHNAQSKVYTFDSKHKERIEAVEAKFNKLREAPQEAINTLKGIKFFKDAQKSGVIDWSTAQVHNTYFQGTNAPPPVKLLESYEDSTMILGLYYAETNRPTNKAVLVMQGVCKLYTEDRDLENSGLVYEWGTYTHKPLNDLLWTDEKTHPAFFENRESKIEMGRYGNVGKELRFFKTREYAIKYAETNGIQKVTGSFFEKYIKARARFDIITGETAQPKVKQFYKIPTRQTVKDSEETQ